MKCRGIFRMPKNESEIMTIEETAEFLRIPVSSVYRLAQNGKIPAQKVGKHWRFYRPALTDWISANGVNFDANIKKEKLDFS